MPANKQKVVYDSKHSSSHMILPCWAALLESSFPLSGFLKPQNNLQVFFNPSGILLPFSAEVSIVTSLVSSVYPTADLLCNTGWRTHYLQSAPQRSPCQCTPWTKVNGEAWDDNKKPTPHIKEIQGGYSHCVIHIFFFRTCTPSLHFQQGKAGTCTEWT